MARKHFWMRFVENFVLRRPPHTLCFSKRGGAKDCLNGCSLILYGIYCKILHTGPLSTFGRLADKIFGFTPRKS